MATTLKLRRGTTAAHSTFTGAAGEVTVDTDKDVVVVHDGTTAGGFPAVRAGGALGTPSSGTVTNLTGTASININGTVGATTPAAGTFTDLTANNSAVISVNTSGDALRITQTGTGNALVVEDSTNPDSTPFVVDASGNIIGGYTTTVPGYVGAATRASSTFNAFGVTTAGNGFSAFGYGVAAVVQRAGLNFNRSESTSIGSHSLVSLNTNLGQINFSGSDGTDFIPAASIVSFVDGTPGTNDMPGRLVFSTTADGASSPTERMRITSAGEVLVGGTTTIASNVGCLTLQGTSNITNVFSFFRDDTAVVAGNNFGALRFYGNDTTSNAVTQLAYITATASGTHAAGDNPTDIVFGTTPDGSDAVTEAVRIKDGGGLQISRTAVTAPAAGDGNVFSGTYTPTLTNSTNVAASTPVECFYTRVGNVVTVAGQVSIDVTTTLTDSVLLMTLPVASTFTVARNCGGTGASSTAGTYGTETIAISANVANGAAEFRLRPTSVANLDYRFSFSYRVL